MNVDYLLSKLKPLIPEQVARWREVLGVADEDLRSLLEAEIRSTAKRLLGDLSEQALLSLPPESAVSGAFPLGTVIYEAPKYPAGLDRGELLQHTAILGRSGAGKTNVVLNLVEQLTLRKVNWLFLDFKRTARALLPRLRRRVQIFTPGRNLAPLGFNPLIVPPGLEPNVYTSLVVDVLADAFTLGDGARSLIQKALTACYANSPAPTLADVLNQLDQAPDKGRVQGWKVTARRALESLAISRALSQDQDAQTAQTGELLRQPTIIELDGLGQPTRSFLTAMLLLWLYYVQLGNGRREHLEQVVIVEEAHHVLYRGQRNRETAMEMVLRQCRELGIGMVIVDQHPHLLSRAALGNAYTIIALNLRDPTDVNVAAGLLQLEDAEKRILGRLRVGEGVVKKQNGHGPFRVDFPLLPIRKGAVTDERLKVYLRGQEPRSAWIRTITAESGDVPRIASLDDPLEPAMLGFLQDVLDHPDDPVRRRYRRLGISARKGQRLRDRLIDANWLESQLVPVGVSRKLVLRVTTGGVAALGIPTGCQSNQRPESIAHAFWKQFYAKRLGREGYAVETEARRNGGAIDVLARRAAERVGIEIETGHSDAVGNVRRGLQAKLDRIVVVATDEDALRQLERALGKAGLLIPGRVYLVLRDEPFRSHRSAA